MAPTHQSAGQASQRRERPFIGGEVLQEAASRAEVAALAGPGYAWSKSETATVGYLAALEPACAGAFHHHVLCVVVCEVGVVVQLSLQPALALEGHQVHGTPATADTVHQQRGHQSQLSHGRAWASTQAHLSTTAPWRSPARARARARAPPRARPRRRAAAGGSCVPGATVPYSCTCVYAVEGV
jgi:hypothetical protein